LEDARQHANPNMTIMLIGNKSDLTVRWLHRSFCVFWKGFIVPPLLLSSPAVVIA